MINPWEFEMELPIAPLSANQMYTKARRRTHKYNSYAKRWREALEDHKFPEDIDQKDVKLKITIRVGVSSPLADLDNVFKPLIDSIAEALEFNDKRIWEIDAKKFKTSKGNEFTSFKLEQIFITGERPRDNQ